MANDRHHVTLPTVSNQNTQRAQFCIFCRLPKNILKIELLEARFLLKRFAKLGLYIRNTILYKLNYITSIKKTQKYYVRCSLNQIVYEQKS